MVVNAGSKYSYDSLKSTISPVLNYIFYVGTLENLIKHISDMRFK